MSRKGSNKKSLHSTPEPGMSSTQCNPMIPPWMGMGMWNPYAGASQAGPSGSGMQMQTAAQQQSRHHSAAKKPWDSSSSSETDSDFAPSQASKKRKAGKAAAPPKHDGAKRGPGRPPKLKPASPATPALPPLFTTNPQVSFMESKECANCRLYEGNVMIKPCNHASFCFKCINNLAVEAEKLGRAPKCPVKDCYVLVDGWIQLYHVGI